LLIIDEIGCLPMSREQANRSAKPRPDICASHFYCNHKSDGLLAATAFDRRHPILRQFCRRYRKTWSVGILNR